MSEGAEFDAETALREWKRNFDARDQLVTDAHAAGLTINRIHLVTGIGRTTIYRILDKAGEE